MQETFDELGTTNRNLYPALKGLIGPHRSRSEWANLADAHPGPSQTRFYAEEALLLLLQLGMNRHTVR